MLYASKTTTATINTATKSNIHDPRVGKNPFIGNPQTAGGCRLRLQRDLSVHVRVDYGLQFCLIAKPLDSLNHFAFFEDKNGGNRSDPELHRQLHVFADVQFTDFGFFV